jgi:alpha-galactosidase
VAAPASAATVVLQRDDSYIAAEGQDTAWTIGNAAMAYTVGFDDFGRLVARELKQAVLGQSWTPARQRDTTFQLDGRDLTLNRSEVGGFTLVGVEATSSPSGIELRLKFTNSRDAVHATRIYAIYPGVPVIETWTVFEATTARIISLSEANSLQMVVDGATLTTVRGQDAPAESGGSFAIERHALNNGDQYPIESTGRSTQTALPLFALRSTQGTFFGGYIWSGSWRIDLIAQARQRLEVTIGLGDTQTVVSTNHPVELPHAFFGVVAGSEADVAPALNRFIVSGLREGRPFATLATYNGWFVSGTSIDRDTLTSQMTTAADAGAEVFEVDAGWYQGAGEQDAYDFSSGLGGWRVDTKKFPEGLRPLGDRARSLGMKFGLWVEPERIDLRLVGEPGMPAESWLAQENGAYQPGVPNDEARTAMLDLGLPEARAWVVDRLSALIEEQGVDYLKWDSNFWVNNTRLRPGRGARDGNYEHVRGLYIVLNELRARYPELLIENCSGGGNRLDLGMMRYTDVGWMDDRTSPSSHVRHNLQGLTTFLPPGYLLSYLIGHPDEPMHQAPDMTKYARSRMPGVLGLSFAAGELDEGDINVIRAATDVWKALRDIERTASAVLLTEQVNGPASPAWDAVALVSPARDQAVLYAFQNDDGVEDARIVLRGLDPTASYAVRSLDTGEAGIATGVALMSTGLQLVATPASGSQLWQLTVATATDTQSATDR